MFGVVKFGGTGMWTVPMAILVAFALLLAVPEDHAPAVVQSASVPYTETVILPEVSRAYSTTSGLESGSAEIVPEYFPGHSAASRNAGAVTANQEELNVTKFGIGYGSSDVKKNSATWNNDDVFYVDIDSGKIYVNMIDESTNTVTTWHVADVLPNHAYYFSSGTVDSSGLYYFSTTSESSIYLGDRFYMIFELAPDTGRLTTWNEKDLVDVGNRIFTDAAANLYFAPPSGVNHGDRYFLSDTISIPPSVPVVELSSSTGLDTLGVEFTTVHIGVESRGNNIYGTLTGPDGTFRLKDNRLAPFGTERWSDSLSIPGTLGEYTATVQDRFGTATVTLTLTEEQKVVQKSSPRPQVGEPRSVSVLVNKLDPDTNQIATFYREGVDLPYMELLEVDASGTMYFGVSHGTRDHYATGIAKFDQSSGTITTWPNIQCINQDVAVAGNKIYCLTDNRMVELDMSSNTLRQWTDQARNSYRSVESIDVDSAGTVFFGRGNSDLVRFVPSTGTFTTFDMEHIRRVHVDSSDTLHAIQQDGYSSYWSALTIR